MLSSFQHILQAGSSSSMVQPILPKKAFWSGLLLLVLPGVDCLRLGGVCGNAGSIDIRGGVVAAPSEKGAVRDEEGLLEEVSAWLC